MFDEEQSEPLTSPDTNNATKFHPDDSTHDSDFRLDGTATHEQHYSRLASHNAGIYNGKWADKTKLRENDNKAVFDAIAGNLELTDHQKRIGRIEYANLDLQELSTPGGIDATLVAIITAAVVVREDGRLYHPAKAEESNDALFLRLLDELEYDSGVIHSAYGKVTFRMDSQ